MSSPNGNSVRTFDMERTICDVLRSRNKIDIQIVNDALKGYVKRKDKNLMLLNQYAERFGISKIVRQYMEVLL